MLPPFTLDTPRLSKSETESVIIVLEDLHECLYGVIIMNCLGMDESEERREGMDENEVVGCDISKCWWKS